MAYLQISNLVKMYGDVPAVRGIDLHVEEGAFVSLLGPSGCGKTTTLRCIAGHETPTEGEITVGGKVLFSSSKGINVAAHKRNFGMVFQSYALWPHMTVRQNVAFPLRLRKYPRKEIESKVEQALNMFGLTGLATRFPAQLSGGQQQRVALARALVYDSDLLLLDEPLSNLDAKLRDQARAVELKALHRRLGRTFIYVTHNQAEALAMSDLVAVMNDGVIRQFASPREIYQNPVDAFVADFVGKVNIVRCRMERTSGDECRLQAEGFSLIAPSSPSAAGEVVAFFRPEDVEIQKGANEVSSGLPNHWVGTVQFSEFLGETVEHHIRVGSVTLRAVTDRKFTVKEGETVGVRIDPADVHVRPADV